MKLDELSEREAILLDALAWMCEQYLKSGDCLDNQCMGAGEDALRALRHFGLVKMPNTRIGYWTEAGRRVLDGALDPDWPPLEPDEV